MKKQVKKNTTLEKNDLTAIGELMGGLLDKQSGALRQALASKKDLTELEARINTRMDEGFESVMQGMDSMAEKLADKEKLERIVEWAITVGEKVGVRPKV